MSLILMRSLFYNINIFPHIQTLIDKGFGGFIISDVQVMSYLLSLRIH